jgi:hypothetical protein
MALTLTQCADWIELTLGGVPSTPSVMTLVNMSGRYLVSMTGWRYLEGVEALLDTVLDQDYITLPSDFSEMKSMVPTDITGTPVVWVTRTDMNILRQQTITGSYGVTSAVLETVAARGATPPTPRIAISPAAASTATGAYRIIYRAGWADVTSDSGYIPIEPWADTLFKLILQTHARGFMREEQGILDERLALISSPKSPVFRAALRSDRRKQTDYGNIVGAIGARYVRRFPQNNVYTTGP